MDGMVGEHVGAPDLIAAVAGYKVLHMDREGKLSSPYHRSCVWRDRKQQADCRKHEQFSWAAWGQAYDVKPSKPPHSAPDQECKCGLYAYHDVEEFFHRYTPIYNGIAVICLTSSTGRLQVHQRGFRAEYQQVEAISVDTSEHFFPQGNVITLDECLENVKSRAGLWEIPYVLDWHNLPTLAEEMGLHPVPKSLLPSADPTPSP